MAVVASLLLALGAQLAGGAGRWLPGGPELAPLAAQAVLLAGFAALAVAAGVCAPLYRRAHEHTHAAAFDERGRVQITPPPGSAPPAEPGRRG